VQALLDQMSQQPGQTFAEMGVARARESLHAFTEMQGPEVVLAKVEDRTIPGPVGEMPIRVYTPDGSAPFPVVVYLHGGGWTIGDIATFDKPCRLLATLSGCVVVSVEYRLAPEHRFPAPLDDCYASVVWVATHGAEIGADPERLAVCGESSGGNLAAAVTLRARARGGPKIVYQALICPATDLGFETASCIRFSKGYLITLEDLQWFRGNYIRSEMDIDNPEVSPLRAHDFAGLPSALVVTAEFDPLCDEGEAYAEKLKAAGVPIRLRRYNRMIHSIFILAGVVDAAKDLYRELGTSLTEALADRIEEPR
jgi:acetyl esterase